MIQSGQPKTVALIELGSGHVLCLYSQILFLRKAGYIVHLICAERLRDQVEGFDNVDHFFFLHHGDDFRGHWNCVLTVRRYLKKNGIRLVVFNSGGGNHTRDISLTAPTGTTLAGIVHHTHKLKGSLTQWLISLRVKKNFVLNDYVLDSVPQKLRKSFESTYLLWREPVEGVSIEKDPASFWVAIPGEVDLRRRAYTELIEKLKKDTLHPSVRFILLGECKHKEDGLTLRNLIEEHGLQHHFLLFDGFVKTSMFMGYIRKSDLLLPLIHPSTHFFSHYKRHQISGTYNISFGDGIPLAMHEAQRGPEDFESSAFFYAEGSIVPLLNRLAEHPEERIAKAKLIRACPKFALGYQYEKYIRFLES